MHAVIENVTEKLRLRSADRRGRYLDHCRQTQEQLPPKKRLSCGNIAHGYAACSDSEKSLIAGMEAAHVGVITSYNDLLSAHHPLALYPDQRYRQGHCPKLIESADEYM